MQYRTLGRTGLQVSIMGMGTGGHDPLGQKSGRAESEMHRLLHRAFELGINYFDTSPGYFDSESILGRALRPLPRSEVVVSSKIALAGDGGVMTQKDVTDSVEASLRRLQMETIDVMYAAVSCPSYLSAVKEEHIPVLERLKEQGKIRFIASSELSRADGAHVWLQSSLPFDWFDVVMVAHNLMNQSAQRSVFPNCRERGLGVVNVFTVRNVFSRPERLREVIADLKSRGVVDADATPDEEPLGWLHDDGDASSLIEAAYRFAAYTSPVTCVMTGTLESAELEENVRNVQKGPLSQAILERLSRIFSRVAEPIGN